MNASSSWFIIAFMCLHVASSNTSAQTAFIPNTPSTNPAMLQTLDSLGRADAKADIDSGRIILKWYGLPSGSESNYAALLLKRYGIFVDFVWGDVLSREQHTYWSAYNGVAKAEISKRYGAGTLDSTSEEAQRLLDKGIDLYGTFPQHRRPEPYTIDVGPHTQFPESLVVQGTYGTIDLDVNILRSGSISNPRVAYVDLFRGPYEENYHWHAADDRSNEDDPVMQGLRPWIAGYIQSMHLKINDHHFSWLYEDTLEQTHQIRIRPELDSVPVTITRGKLSFPLTVVGTRDLCDIFLVCWVDRSGKLQHWKLYNIILQKYRGVEDGSARYDHKYCSTKSALSDTTGRVEGEAWLYEKLKEPIAKALGKTKFVPKNSTRYFQYFETARVVLHFSNQKHGVTK